MLVAGLLATAGCSSADPGIESVCYGTASHGRLENGAQIASSGPNFTPYSTLGVSLRRTYVHSKVAATIARAYATMAVRDPAKRYVYGESGWREGGRIRPHRTHQNGTAVDFLVPVLAADGRSVPLPTGVGNRFGYGIEFDASARYEGLAIDFDAIAEHLAALDAAAKVEGIGIARVIFEKAYLPKLFAAPHGAWVKANVPFMQGEPWIRHDEHYHVDFAVKCRSMKDGGGK